MTVGLLTLIGTTLRAFAILGLLLYLGIGIVHIYAGMQVLNLRERGRILGVAVAGLGLVVGLFAAFASAGAIVLVAVDAFIVYTLAKSRPLFHP